MTRRATALAVMGLAWASTAVASYVPRTEVEAALQAAAQQSKAAAADVASTSAIAQSSLRDARAQLQRAPLLAEARAWQALRQLRDVTTPDEASRAAVTAWLEHVAITMTDPVDTGHPHGGQTVAAFPIDAAARSLLRSWDRTAAVAALTTALTQGKLDEAKAVQDRAAWQAVIRTAPASDDALLRQAAPKDVEVQAALALRLIEPDLARAVLRAAPDHAGFGLIRTLPTRFVVSDVITVLTDPGLHKGYRSAARIALAPYVAQDAALRTHLLSTLGDSDGGASAQALAADPAAITPLIQLARNDDATVRARAVLALKLMNTSSARDALSTLAATPDWDLGLAQQIQRWQR